MGEECLEQLDGIIKPVVESMGFVLVGCELHGGGGHYRAILRVYVEGENGITADQLAQVSRRIAAILDVENPISGAYTLEVSSPGIERPLFTREHYQRFIGHSVKVRLAFPQEGIKNFRGVLTAVEEKSIVLDCTGKATKFLLADIDKARLVADF